VAEQVLARGDAAGIAIWTGTPAYDVFIEKAGKAGVPVILPHFPTPEGSKPGATGVVSCDPAAYAAAAADEIGKAVGGKGTVAVSQGGFNSTENLVAETFKKRMAEKFPDMKVLDPVEETFDSTKAAATATAVLQAHPDAVAALSTTGGGPTTWATAQRNVGRKIVIIGMDYTRVNLDLVRDGEVYAVVAQPLWDESYQAAELLAKAAKVEKVPWWTKLDAPIVTKDKTGPYYELLDKVDKAVGR
jgi:ribose transport system substrate-binding protein